MKANRLKRGFTLLELTVVILMGMAISAMLMALFNQQLAFLQLFKAQSFLIDEAPIISMQVNRLVSKAERFRLHATVADALSGTNARLTASPVLVMNFRQPDGSMRATILSYEDNALKYYIVPQAGPIGAAQWTLTKKPSNVSFTINNGILQLTLTGPAGEEITYSGTVQSGESIDRSGTINQ